MADLAQAPRDPEREFTARLDRSFAADLLQQTLTIPLFAIPALGIGGVVPVWSGWNWPTLSSHALAVLAAACIALGVFLGVWVVLRFNRWFDTRYHRAPQAQ